MRQRNSRKSGIKISGKSPIFRRTITEEKQKSRNSTEQQLNHSLRQENKQEEFTATAFDLTKAFDFALISMRNGLSIPDASEMLLRVGK